MPKTNAQRQRECRQRRKDRQQSSIRIEADMQTASAFRHLAVTHGKTHAEALQMCTLIAEQLLTGRVTLTPTQDADIGSQSPVWRITP